ncbi:EAL domain-containing protein [Thalassotalea sp. M1531]|uniref:EAL domain-containing protein n=1 Tax=Thalassotalea algicola TaxID=2716224 RepID=A0A7Y0LDP9_9GAMM|nr:EAL domain-containing protein [Thalassotalea algicola]NMP32294.1 EAL domain-containing protein [Thalassotalea algicola]
MKKLTLKLFNTFLVTLVLISVTSYVLFVSTLAKELDTPANLPQFDKTNLTQTELSAMEDWSTNILLLPNVKKYNQHLVIEYYDGGNDLKAISLKATLFKTFLAITFPLTSLIAVSIIMFMMAGKYHRAKLNTVLESLAEKAEQSAEVLGKEVREKEEQSYSALMRINTALDGLESHAREYHLKSESNAHRDRLTKLVNRHRFLEHITEQLEVSERNNVKSGLLFIDLDGFKQVNDSFGHSFGDEVLIQVAERLKTIVRIEKLSYKQVDADLEYNLARLGGDEFTLFVETLDDSERMVDIAKHVLKEIEKDFVLGNKEIKISASIGLAVYPDSANSPEALVQMADVAMYRAKKEGRGIYRIYSPEMGSTMRRYHYLLEEMRVALDTNCFFLSFQPIIHVDGSAISYFEALVRWQHPAEGTIAPTEFIPIAEDSNLILKLGDWILEEACRQMAAWYNAGMSKTRISVNLSGIQLKHRRIHEWVMECLDKMSLPANSLMLEITESCFIDISDSIIDELNKLRAEGVIIAIDDFGTGFSSLSVLANLPVDVLKIDKLFISEATKNKKYHKILHSIAELSTRLDLKVVAEGIEEIEQLELLKSLGVVYIQGYLVSRPESSANVGSRVLKQSANHLSQTGTGVWPPQTSRLINTVSK